MGKFRKLQQKKYKISNIQRTSYQEKKKKVSKISRKEIPCRKSKQD